MTSNIAFTGLASGLNTSALIQNVLRFGQKGITTLQQKVTTETTQQTAFQGLQNELQTLANDANQLGQPQGGVFDARTASTTNSSILTAAAGTGAQTGSTSLTVLALAQANQIASQGFSDPSSSITKGTFQISAGSNTASITIDSTNNTLSGLASAINGANVGVTATIINTGSTDSTTQPYRLLLTSNSTGTANAIKITNSLGANGNGSVLPNFSTTEIGPAVPAAKFSGTSTVSANSGAGNYTGTSNDTYTFTVVSGGAVGTDNNIKVGYSNSDGSITGTLTLNSSDAGTPQAVANGLQVNFGTGTLNAGDQFSVSAYVPTIQAAANSKVQIGSGSGALVVQNSSNVLSNLIPGVTLSLQGADPTHAVQVNVGNDVSSVTTQITNFINDYNSFLSDFNKQTAYAPGSGTAAGTSGPLNGNTNLNAVATQVEQTLLNTVSNVSSKLNSLSSLGITVGATGQLTINSSKLNSALTGGVSGVGFNDVKRLFSLQGQSSSPGVQFADGNNKTKPTTSAPYTVHITQAATQASVTASSQLASTTVIDGTNNTISLTVNGKSSSTITLASGTYTQQGLASEIQTAINTQIEANGGSVTVGLSNNSLQITNNLYGTNSKIESLSGSALATLGFTGSESSTGTDVQGSFIVNGVTETAKGVGQALTGDANNANTSGLVVAVTLTPSQIAAGGTDSTLSITQGIAASLNNSLNSLLDPTSGELTQIATSIQSQITNDQAEVTKAQNALTAQQAALQTEFATLETTLAALQSQSSLLTAFSDAGYQGTNTTRSTSTTSSLPNFSTAQATQVASG